MAQSCLRRGFTYVCSLIWVVGGADASLLGQVCRSDAASERMATGGWVAPDGRVHYTIGLDPDVPDGVRTAVVRATEDWNKLRETTNVVLDVAPKNVAPNNASQPSRRVDLIVRPSSVPKEHCGCASIKTGESVIYYSIRDYGDWVASHQHPHAAPVVMSHEIGHFLGLDDTATVMNSIMAPGELSCEGYARNPRVPWPTKEDGKLVGACVRKHREALANRPK